MDRELFWNICDFWEEESMRDGARGGHESGPRHPSRGAPPISWATRKAVDALLWPQESYFLENDLGEGFNPIRVMDL